ncbi:MAG: hypothetical protein GY760_03420 [Deltaproteobacteria bacterium]|nr:hypothetical protein [Deltaproteobacteria bacterium]
MKKKSIIIISALVLLVSITACNANKIAFGNDLDAKDIGMKFGENEYTDSSFKIAFGNDLGTNAIG